MRVDYKESWALKNWCFWTVLLEKTLESLLDCKEIKPVIPKGSQSWIFIGRTDAEAEAPLFWPPNAKNWLLRKDPDPGKDWRQEEKGTTEDKTVGWHHWLNGYEFEPSLGVGRRRQWHPTPVFLPGESQGQGSLVGFRLRGRTELTLLKRLSSSNSSSRGEFNLGPEMRLHYSELLCNKVL